jgi:hypothetical protein
MAVAVHVGGQQDELSGVALRIQRLAAAGSVYAWVDDAGDFYVTQTAPRSIPKAQVLGPYRRGCAVGTIEADLAALPSVGPRAEA